MRGSRRSLAHFLPPSPPSPNERKDKERNEQKVFSLSPTLAFFFPLRCRFLISFFSSLPAESSRRIFFSVRETLGCGKKEIGSWRGGGWLVCWMLLTAQGKERESIIPWLRGRRREEKLKICFGRTRPGKSSGSSPLLSPFLRGKLKGKQGRAEGGAPSAGECFCFCRSCFIGKQSKAIEGKEGEENPQHTADSQFSAAEEDKSFLHPPPPTKKKKKGEAWSEFERSSSSWKRKRGLRSDGRRKEEEEEEAVAASAAGERRRENSIRVRSVLIAAVEEGGREGAVGIQGEGIAKIS